MITISEILPHYTVFSQLVKYCIFNTFASIKLMLNIKFCMMIICPDIYGSFYHLHTFICKKGAVLRRPLINYLLCTWSSENASWIRKSKNVSFSSFISNITSIEVAFHSSFDRGSIKMFHPVWYICFDEKCIRIN